MYSAYLYATIQLHIRPDMQLDCWQRRRSTAAATVGTTGGTKSASMQMSGLYNDLSGNTAQQGYSTSHALQARMVMYVLAEFQCVHSTAQHST